MDDDQREIQPNLGRKFLPRITVKRLAFLALASYVLYRAFRKNPVLPNGNGGFNSTDPRGFAEAIPAWAPGTEMEMRIFISTSLDPLDAFRSLPRGTTNLSTPDTPVVIWKDIVYGDFKQERSIDLDVEIPDAVARNASSLWLDIFLIKNLEEKGSAASSTGAPLGNDTAVVRRQLLTPDLAILHVAANATVFQGYDLTNDTIKHWYPSIILDLISPTAIAMQHATKAVGPNEQPQNSTSRLNQLSAHSRNPSDILLSTTPDETGSKALYYPIVFANTLQRDRRRYFPIDETTTSLPLRLTLRPTTFVKFKWAATMQLFFDYCEKYSLTVGLMQFIKDAIFSSSRWVQLLLGLLIIRLFCHVVYICADVLYWDSKADVAGVSVRTLIVDVAIELVIALRKRALRPDKNNPVTALLVSYSLVINIWKLVKVIFHLRGNPTEEQKKTNESDKLAYRYVWYSIIPLLSIISLLAYHIASSSKPNEDKWGRYMLAIILVLFFRTLGFIRFLPQLYVNYKMKRVAHIPLSAIIFGTVGFLADNLRADIGLIACRWVENNLFCKSYQTGALTWARVLVLRDTIVFIVLLVQWRLFRTGKKPKGVNGADRQLGGLLSEMKVVGEKA